jgi:WD40 repeat protein
VWNVAISPDGNRIASAGLDPKVHVWDATTGQITRTFPEITGAVFSVAFSPDGRRLAAAGVQAGGPKSQVAKVWDADTGRNTITISETRGIFALEFSPDRRWLALGMSDGTVNLRDGVTGREIGLVGKHAHEVRGVAFRSDGRRLASASNDRTVKVWDVTRAMETNSPQPVLTLPGSDAGFWGVAFSPDGRRLAAGSGDGRLTLWDAETGQQIRSVPGQFSGQGLSVAFSPDGRWVASAAEDCTVKLWDAAALEWKHTFRGHTAPVRSLAFSRDGRRLVTGCQDRTVKVWDLSQLKPN